MAYESVILPRSGAKMDGCIYELMNNPLFLGCGRFEHQNFFNCITGHVWCSCNFCIICGIIWKFPFPEPKTLVQELILTRRLGWRGVRDSAGQKLFWLFSGGNETLLDKTFLWCWISVDQKKSNNDEEEFQQVTIGDINAAVESLFKSSNLSYIKNLQFYQR